jgi:hypothetical protein
MYQAHAVCRSLVQAETSDGTRRVPDTLGTSAPVFGAITPAIALLPFVLFDRRRDGDFG